MMKFPMQYLLLLASLGWSGPMVAAQLLAARESANTKNVQVKEATTTSSLRVPETFDIGVPPLDTSDDIAKKTRLRAGATPTRTAPTTNVLQESTTVTRGGDTSSTRGSPAETLTGGGWWTDTPPTHEVCGNIKYRYINRFPDDDSEDRPDYPFRKHVKTEWLEAPVRFAIVVLRDAQGETSLKSKLDGNGDYCFEWVRPEINPSEWIVAPGGTTSVMASVTVWSVSDAGTYRKAAVGAWKHGDLTDASEQFTSDPGDYLAYSYTTSFPVADAAVASGGANVDITIPYWHPSAKPFFQMDQSMLSIDYFRQISGVNEFPKINLIYTPDHLVSDSTTGIYIPSIHPGFVHIASKPNDFGWSGFAVRHEVAHVFQRHYIRDHTYGKLGEPLANVHALAMVGSSWMDKLASFEDLDFQANYADGAFRLEGSSGTYWEYCDLCDFGTTSYGWTQRVFWDLIDDTQAQSPEPITTYYPYQSNSAQNYGTFDNIDGGGGPNQSNNAGSHKLNEVLVGYLGGGVYGSLNPDYEDRGYEGVDVVDVVEGMIYHGHATVNQVKDLLNDGMDFGYVEA